MGPAIDSSSAGLPSRPRFSWDIKNVPWTNGKGNQEEYAKAVALWDAFHNKLPDYNSNKISIELRGIMLHSQLYGRAKDIRRLIADDDIQSGTGWKKIVEAVYKRDTLSVFSEVYQSYLGVLSMKRGSNETFRNFESRFMAQVSKFNSTTTSCKIPETLMAFTLLANSSVDNNQRISVLADLSNGNSLGPDSTTDQYLESVSYEKFASVLRQCDKAKTDKRTRVRSEMLSLSTRLMLLVRASTSRDSNPEKAT